MAFFFTTYQGLIVYLLNMILILTLILILILIMIPVPAGLFSYSYTHIRIFFLLLLSRGISNKLDLSKRHEDNLVLY